MSVRRPRARTDKFDGAALAEALKKFARLKDLEWDWEIRRYSKTRRSQAPDRRGLEVYSPLLQVILSFSPSGFPNHTILRDVWLELEDQYGVRDKSCTLRLADWANLSADAVRRATKHVVDLRRSGTQFLTPSVQALVDLIQDQESASAAGEASTMSVSDPPIQRRQLAVNISDESVVFCAAHCHCLVCEPVVAVPSDPEPSSSPGGESRVADDEELVASRS